MAEATFNYRIPAQDPGGGRVPASVEAVSELDATALRNLAALQDFGKLTGHLEFADRHRICGWALNEATPVEPVVLTILDNDVPIARVTAERFREDLRQAGKSTGKHFFELTIPAGLSPTVAHVIRVQREVDGRPLHGSPRTIAAAAAPAIATAAGAVSGAVESRSPQATPPAPLAAAPPVQSPPTPRLKGHVDGITRNRVAGWALDEANPTQRVILRILDNDVLLARVTAEGFRPDLKRGSIGDGSHGFEYIVPGGLSRHVAHVIRVVRESDGMELRGSPGTIAVAVGALDSVSRTSISGWARDPDHPTRPVAVQILDNGVLVGRVLANRFRQDLKNAGYGEGMHGYKLDIPGGLSPLARHVLQVQRESDAKELPGSPQVLEASTAYDRALEQTFAGAVKGLATRDEIDTALAFTAGQMERLLRQHADLDSHATSRQRAQEFRRRWGSVLPATEPAEAGPPDDTLRAFVVDEIPPSSGHNAGAQAMLSHTHALQQLGYTVTVATPGFAKPNAAVLQRLQADGIAYCMEPYYTSVEDVLRRQANCFDLIYLHRVSNASRYMALARHYCPKARVVYSVADLHHLRVARQAALEGRPELEKYSDWLRYTEFTAAACADAVITHSSVEAQILRAAVSGAKVYEVPWATNAKPVTASFQERSGVAFIGSYSHKPNVDAAGYLTEEIMPLVWQTHPEIECLLVGSDMPESLGRERRGIRALGLVEDLAEVFNRVRLTVAPLRYGAGVKGKVLESLGAGLPCVMSPVAAEGLPLPECLQRLIGTGADAIAALICAMHGDASANSRASRAGIDFIGQWFDPASVRNALKAAIDGVPPRR
jgi:glycosyltransferase involved in cell wall biosynthesis